MLQAKKNIADLALLGGSSLFEVPRSTSNLVKPDIDRFLKYSRVFYESGQYTNNGPLVRELERRLAEFHQTDFCVSFCNGFWALVLAIRCMALPGRREVVMPSMTYRRLGDVVAWAGLVPRFCDVDPASLAMSPASAEPHIGPDTALLLGVHPIVNTCDAEGLEQLATKHGVPVLFDAVESVYETINGKRVGGFGSLECFSLHASKLINGFEGGYITTNDGEIAVRLSAMRGFGFVKQDTVVDIGTNAKLNEVHAAMALASLDDIDDQVVRNRARYRIYQDGLASISGLRLLAFDESERCSFKNIVVELTDDWPLTRDETVKLLNAERVLARVYYSPPLHLKPTAYETISIPLPETEKLSNRFMLLPCGHMVEHEELRMIADLLCFINENAAAISQKVEL
jgi:dTDP-4-amino-4,6-dideoxygalactose transaminase